MEAYNINSFDHFTSDNYNIYSSQTHIFSLTTWVINTFLVIYARDH